MSPDSSASAASRFELEHFLPYRLSLLTNTVSQGIASGYQREHELTVTEWRILAVLGRFPGRTASEVVERTAMDKVAISRAVKSLMKRGLLTRKTDSFDRRRRQLLISEGLGRRVLEEVVPTAQNYEKELLGALNKAERTHLDKLLGKLQEQAARLKDSAEQ